MAMLLLGTAFFGWCHDFEVDGIYYNYNDNGMSVSVTAKDENYGWMVYKNVVTVPGEVAYNGMTYVVTAIGDKAFNSCPSLTGVVLPSTITKIGDHAFSRNSNLVSVNIPDGVTTIGEEAFMGDGRLAAIALGPGVAHIGAKAFSACYGLESITVDPVNPVYDSRENCNAIIERATGTMLYGCKNTIIPSQVTAISDWAFAQGTAPAALVIPGSVVSIGDYAFSYCNGLATLTLDDGVEAIGSNAFNGCRSLTSVELPASLSDIGDEAFVGCWNLTGIVVDENNPTYDSRGGCNAIVETATGTLLLGCKTTVMPQGITSIGRSAFAWSRITSVHIPEGVTTIGDYAFDHCYYIDDLQLPNTLVSIGYSAFNGAYAGLDELVLPNSLVSLGGYAFACCSGVTAIRFGSGLETIGDHAFFSCSGLTELDLPRSLLTIGDGAFMGCTGLTSVNIPAMVTHIGSAVFQACSGLIRLTVDAKNVTFDSRDECNAVIESSTNTLVVGCITTVIPATVTTLGDGAFCECIGLNTIAIPPSVTAIGNHTFDYCYDLQHIVLPPELRTIGNSAFAGCEQLVSIIIPDRVESIGDSAFYDCPWMEYLTLGRGLTSIGRYAFCGTNLVTVTCRAMEPPVIAAENSFWHYGTYSDATLKVPSPALSRYTVADYWSLFPVIVASGDVNGDGRLGIDDVTTLIAGLLGSNDDILHSAAADMDNDQAVNISDVTAIINLLLSEDRPGVPR